MASAYAAKAAGGGAGIGDQLGGELGWQPAQKEGMQYQTRGAGGEVGPEGQNAVHEDRWLLVSKREQIPKVLNFFSSVLPEALQRRILSSS